MFCSVLFMQGMFSINVFCTVYNHYTVNGQEACASNFFLAPMKCIIVQKARSISPETKNRSSSTSLVLIREINFSCNLPLFCKTCLFLLCTKNASAK